MNAVRKEDLLELAFGKAIGHAGHEVRHGPQIIAAAYDPILLRHLVDIGDVIVEKALYKALCLLGLLHHHF